MPYFRRRRKRVLTLTAAWGSLNGIGHYNVDGSDGTVAILQAPEFLSDVDKSNNPNNPIPINADQYDLPFQYGKPKDDMVVVDALAVANNRPVVYSIVAGNAGGLYEIDPATGKIAFAKDVTDMSYTGGTLQVKVADAAIPGLYDLATVTFTFGWAEFVMCVDQAVSGTRGIHNPSDLSDVGHTFWHIKTSTGLKSNLASIPTGLRSYLDNSWGYYPTSPVFPSTNENVAGYIRNDNDKHAKVDVYKEYVIPNFSSLVSLLQYTHDTKTNPNIYRLQSYNCTTVAIAAADVAGVVVPKTIGDHTITVDLPIIGPITYHFIGYNPGDLGEDIASEGGVRGPYTP